MLIRILPVYMPDWALAGGSSDQVGITTPAARASFKNSLRSMSILLGSSQCSFVEELRVAQHVGEHRGPGTTRVVGVVGVVVGAVHRACGRRRAIGPGVGEELHRALDLGVGGG